jgi:uncharacterized protein (DUF1778 family)
MYDGGEEMTIMGTKATEYKNKWQKEHKDIIRIVTDKETGRMIREAAGKNLSAFVLQAIREKMERQK